MPSKRRKQAMEQKKVRRKKEHQDRKGMSKYADKRRREFEEMRREFAEGTD